MKAPDLQPVRSRNGGPLQRAVTYRQHQLLQDQVDAKRWLEGRGRTRGFLRRLIGR